MNKIKIEQPRREENYIGELEEKLQDSPLTFVPKKEIERYQIEIEHAGYEPVLIEVFGEEIGVVMKQELRGALIDPSGDDVDTLTSAGNSYGKYASKKYGENAKIPNQTSFGRFIEDSKINSLIMNIFRFPTNEINSEKMQEYGLDREDVLGLANKAYRVYCETTGSLDIGGGMDCLDSVGGKISKNHGGNSDSVDMSSDVCHAGSHYKLNFKTERIQKDAQKPLPVFSEEYISYERQAVEIMRKHNPRLTEQTATNLFRMFLNLGGGYDSGKALPIK